MKKNKFLSGIPVMVTHLVIIFSICKINAQPASWNSRGIGGGGSLYSPSISHFDAQNIYIACDMSEVFHTTNAGTSWTTLPFQQISAVTNSKVQFTSDANILYALNYDFFNDLSFPVKSTDGGATWSPLASDPTAGGAYYLFADDNSTSRIILSSYNKIYFSNNGGSTFTNIYTNMGSGAAYIGGVFWDGTNIYIGAAKNLIVSADNGATFNSYTLTGISATRGIMSFAGAKSGATTRFFITSFNLADIYPGVSGADFSLYKNIYKMDYSVGASWVAVTSGITGSNKPFFIDMAKNNIDVAYVAGGNTSTAYPVVFKTTNGGTTWSAVFLTSNNQNIYTGYQGEGGDEGWYYDEFALGFDVKNNDADVAVITGLGFSHYTNNGGTTWQQQYVNTADQNPLNTLIEKGKNYGGVGLENTSCWTMVWSDALNIFSGFTDITAIRSNDGGNKWNKNYSTLTENTVYKAIKNAAGTLYIATSSVHDMYESTYLQDSKIDAGTGRILYSNDEGESWNVLHDFAKPVIWVELDPTTANKMYACVINSSTGGIYVSTNINLGSSSTFTKLNNPPRTEGHPYQLNVLNDGTLIAVYSGRRDAAGTFTASSGVFKSTDGGTTWTDISDAGMYYWTKDLIIDANDASQNTFYCSVFSGWGGAPNGLGGIYKTVNRGASWTKINSSDRVESCTINPNNANQMYFSTESEGLWVTNNLSAPTPTFTQVANYPFQHPMRIFFNPYNENEIWVTSFGNGMRMGLDNNCATPTGFVVSAVTSTSATLSWTATAGAGSYKITRKVAGVAAVNYTAYTNTYTFTDLTPATNNRINVKAKCGSVFSDRSVNIIINTPPMRTALSGNEILVYPNPVRDVLYIKLNSVPVKIQLANIEGKIIYADEINTFEYTFALDVSNFADGIYFLTLSYEKNSGYGKENYKIIVSQ